MSKVAAATKLEFSPDFDDTVGLNLTAYGLRDRTITAVDSVTVEEKSGSSWVTSDDLTIDDEAPNSALEEGQLGQDVAVGKMATWHQSGGMAGVNYRLTVKYTMSDGNSDSAVLLAECREG